MMSVISETKFDPQKKFIDEALQAHNYYRIRHGVPRLIHNPELSNIALKHALEMASKNQMEHSTNTYKGKPLGENLAMWFQANAKHYDGKQASKQWYNEIDDYDFSRPKFNVKTGNFTQLVWKDSREVGFGVAIALNGYFYAVATYYPAGNITKKFEENVLESVIERQPSSRDSTLGKQRAVANEPQVEDITPIEQNNDGIEQRDDEIDDEKVGCCSGLLVERQPSATNSILSKEKPVINEPQEVRSPSIKQKPVMDEPEEEDITPIKQKDDDEDDEKIGCCSGLLIERQPSATNSTLANQKPVTDEPRGDRTPSIKQKPVIDDTRGVRLPPIKQKVVVNEPQRNNTPIKQKDDDEDDGKLGCCSGLLVERESSATEKRLFKRKIGVVKAQKNNKPFKQTIKKKEGESDENLGCCLGLLVEKEPS